MAIIKSYEIIDRVSDLQLVMCKFWGTLSAESVEPLLKDVHELELRYPQGFNRFSNLGGIEALTVSTKYIHDISERRTREYNGPPVISAMYASDSLSFGMMRIYAAMMDPSPISVSVFYDIPEAAQWLGVAIDELQHPKPAR